MGKDMRFLREHKGDPQNLLSHLKMRFGINYYNKALVIGVRS